MESAAFGFVDEPVRYEFMRGGAQCVDAEPEPLHV